MLGHRRLVACGVWRGGNGDCARRGLQRMACQPLGVYNPPFASSMGLQTAFASPDETFSPLITFSLTYHQSPQWPLSIWIPVITISIFPLLFGPFKGLLQPGTAVPPSSATRTPVTRKTTAPSHPSGSCCAVLGKHRTHNTRFQVSTTEVARLIT